MVDIDLLDKEQQEIVNSPASNIIVAAGAGSGKTRVLTERVKRLLSEGVNPTSVVVITFTNMAAEELQERLLNVPNSEKCFIGTIHSLANKLLSSTEYTYDIFSQYYQDTYMKYLINHFAKYCSEVDYDNLVRMFKQVHMGNMDYEELVNSFPCKTLDELYILLGNNMQHDSLKYSDYPYDVMDLCQINNVITFDELLSKCSEYFTDNHTNIEYLFVDELQDIGYLEYEFLMDLNSPHNFFIGDDFQAIYGFKGGDVNIFLSLLKDPNWQSYYMVNNYRNSSVILNYANSIIKHADDIIPKNPVCKSNEVGRMQIRSKLELGSFLTAFPNQYNSYKNWFVLTRTNKDLQLVCKQLESHNIPVITFKQSELSKAEKDDALQQNAIKLLTIHAAKGLEEDNVLLYGNFPLIPTARTKSEEIKVFYVGITRAKTNLLIFNGK